MSDLAFMMKTGEGTIPAMIADPILGNELVGWVGAIIFAFNDNDNGLIHDDK
jgi:hypothetical protein